MNGSSKAVGSVISDSDSILEGLELGNGGDRPKDFFLHDLHALVDIGEDGGLDEVTFSSMACATAFDGSTLLLAVFDV